MSTDGELNTAPSRVPEAALVRGHVTCPADESDETVERCVRLTLERESPLPLPKLAWGWVRTSDGARYHAASRHRLNLLGFATDSTDGAPILPACGNEAEARSPYADMRDRSVLAALAEQANRERLNARLHRISAGIAGCGLALWVLGLGIGIANENRKRRLETDGAKLAEIEAKAAIAGNADGGGTTLRYFKALGEINHCRPDGVIFTRVEWNTGHYDVQGRADSVDAANRFVKTLRENPAMREVTTEDLSTQGGLTRFRLKLKTKTP